ncbi:MAG: 5-formyltetrahydrofolate cyclo-ligase [Terriglobia bacterium]
MKEKQEWREYIWRLLEERGVARFPGARGRIPNFTGAERCADRVEQLDLWQRARTLKANPDSPQRALRQRALEQGKIVYMAVPRLGKLACFIELDPQRLPRPAQAATIKGAMRYGRPVRLEEMAKIDLVLCGSVVVNRRGERLGKGSGYSDLEYALAAEAGKLGDNTPILTTLHPLQIIGDALPWRPHDIGVDCIVTPAEAICTRPLHPRPPGVLWHFLDENKIAAIPILAQQAMKSKN